MVRDKVESRARYLHSLGWSQARIAREFGVSSSSVNAWLQLWGLRAHQYQAGWNEAWPDEQNLSNFRAQFETHAGDVCWPWLGPCDPKGYGNFSQGVTQTNSHMKAYRFSWAIANGRPIPKGGHILHSCDNPPCVKPEHLRLGTSLDNMRDRASKGRSAPRAGVDNGQAKLTDQMVREIREHIRVGETQRNIAKLFGVCQQVISDINRGKTWSHVK